MIFKLLEENKEQKNVRFSKFHRVMCLFLSLKTIFKLLEENKEQKNVTLSKCHIVTVEIDIFRREFDVFLCHKKYVGPCHIFLRGENCMFPFCVQFTKKSDLSSKALPDSPWTHKWEAEMHQN